MKFEFFYGGSFSQWHKTIFKDNNGFNCAEQYMMYQKAVLFNYIESATKILATDNPRLQKQLGRNSKFFDWEIWDKHKIDIN